MFNQVPHTSEARDSNSNSVLCFQKINMWTAQRTVVPSRTNRQMFTYFKSPEYNFSSVHGTSNLVFIGRIIAVRIELIESAKIDTSFPATKKDFHFLLTET